MASRKPSLDLEKELTCSICTELLYQPLTLLDCLHTFCGACLKEWFSFQAAKAEKAPIPPSSPDAIFTCPSCRSSVRDTRHNATVVTLLDMFVAANSAKARSQVDRAEMAVKYKPGDTVLPKVKFRERSADEKRADEEERRLLDEVRQISLLEATPGQALSERSRRQQHGRSEDARSRSSRPQSLDTRRRAARDASGTRSSQNSGPQAQDPGTSAEEEEEPGQRRRRSDSRQRQVEHQTSIRSLIGSSQMSERDIEREIEDFARQIQEEGLLDGLDLDNIDLTRDDDLSRRITEAYRRRQRERSRRDLTRSRDGTTNRSDSNQLNARPRASENEPISRDSSRSTSQSRQPEDRGRRTLMASANLDVTDPMRRPRRRTASGGRATIATNPMLPLLATSRPAARSQTDLNLRPRDSDPATPQQGYSDGRSLSSQSVPLTSPSMNDLPPTPSANNASFARRVPQLNLHLPDLSALSARESTAVQRTRPYAPNELAASSPLSGSAPFSGHRRTRSQLYPESSISCSRCRKQHIEYDVHYNCAICAGGQWNMCLHCYRSGKGCHHWFGFGYGAWSKWEKMRLQGNGQLEMPHMLTASRYRPPPSTPGGADGRKTLTPDDPSGRLETGTFCARCLAWTNDCYWRCNACNEGDWGFCNDCVNHGRSCTHMLLPLTREAAQSPDRAQSPRAPERPAAATLYTGPEATSIGSFRPLTFRNSCDVCQDLIPPSHARYHCYSCISSLVSDANPGTFEICSSCYDSLVSRGQISAENGPHGWRRCLKGHRMAVVGFTEGKGGQWRHIERDMVGGRALRSEPLEGLEGTEQTPQRLQRWTWRRDKEKWERLATRDVSTTAPSTMGAVSFAQTFPPDGGAGMRATARWAWYPQAGSEDELLFPKGAEIREIEDVNGDWFFGTYMGAKGLFPAPYVSTWRRT